ncbi:MAG: hypothetical protein KDB82_07025 [Planctomycetes bacterium]|nr:hypothetical protein [Planctomycetota bacterium]
MSTEAERDFERKLERNPELKKQVEALQHAIELLGSVPVVEPKEGFDQRVIGRIREEELADRARSQINKAPVPLWQHAVQIGIGAAAAALILAMVGMPGLFHGDDAEGLEQLGGESAMPVARVTPTEEDLLPALADHEARFESMRRNVVHTRVNDPDLQRQLIAMELEYSDLTRRNRWLATEIADLPANRRAEYEQFLEKLDAALKTLSDEVSRSRADGEPVDMSAVIEALNGVGVPQGKLGKYRISYNSGSPLGAETGAPVADYRTLDEVTLYALVRKAEYRHDFEAVIETADFYLSRQGAGRFKDQANASVIAANLRLGRDEDAARRFIDTFGQYDEDMSSSQREVIRGFLSDSEYKRLLEARKALRDS